MAEELRDLRAKITVQTDVALTGVSLGRGIEKGELVRQILHTWASEHLLVTKLTQAAMRREGIEGNDK